MEFGYGISAPRGVDMDRNDMAVSRDVSRQVPSLATCLGCGGCSATCTAGALTEFSLRRAHTLLRRGETSGVHTMMNKCMLCGKCRMVCPREINTRAVVMASKHILGGYR